MVGVPGVYEPGLPTTERLPEGVVAVVIDVARLRPPLQAMADDPSSPNSHGHVSITPVDESGRVDDRLLREWAESRAPDGCHPLTQNVLDAVSDAKVKGPA
jgi:hypothetical protein